MKWLTHVTWLRPVCLSNQWFRKIAMLVAVIVLALGVAQSTFADDTLPSPCPTCPNLGYDYSGMIGDNTPPRLNPDGSEAAMPPVVLGPNDQKINDQKLALVAKYQQVLSGNLSETEFSVDAASVLRSIGEDPQQHKLGDHTGCKDGDIACHDTSDGSSTSKAGSPPPGMPNSQISNYLIAMQQAGEVTSYYCGPAAAWSMLIALGDYYSYYGEPLTPTSTGQHTLAATCTGCPDTRGKYLQTDSFGQTPWVAEAGHYPMPSGLNNWRIGSPSGFFTPRTVTNDGQGLATFKSNLTFDIDLGYPLAADIVENAWGTHLPGHPMNYTIYHWLALRGYNNYGDNTRYADPAYSDSVSWGHDSGMVPFNSVLTQTVMLPLVSRRGYVW